MLVSESLYALDSNAFLCGINNCAALHKSGSGPLPAPLVSTPFALNAALAQLGTRSGYLNAPTCCPQVLAAAKMLAKELQELQEDFIAEQYSQNG